MLFNSALFLFVFLPIVWIGYFLLNYVCKPFWGKVWLILSSFVFYAYWETSYIFVILVSIAVNYATSLKILDARQRGKGKMSLFFLIFGILFNIGFLGYFKYADFVVQNLLTLNLVSIEPLNVLLPLAISFFTFQQIAYLSDCYLQKQQGDGLLNYVLFVCFFPQLIAGPIVHRQQIIPQFLDVKNLYVKWNFMITGLAIFIMGLFKKVVIADSFGAWSDAGFNNTDMLGAIDAWATALSYSLQIYFDFSGYSDMAIGLALLFNIQLPTNFNSPYKALTIRDFWRRWHITLSTWLRNYVYVPLGGNRRGTKIMYGSLLGTFLLGGIWHGANWTFVIWGALHGVAMIIYRMWQILPWRLPRALSWILTFLFVCISFIFFRASEPAQAILIINKMFTIESALWYFDQAFVDQLSNVSGVALQSLLPWSETVIVPTMSLIVAFFTLLVLAKTPNTMQMKDNLLAKKETSYLLIVYVTILGAIAISLMIGKSSEVFLYFNF